ncbi:MAG: sulfotransferase [Actinobacteria bacterium]|nr:sulfotransferase [Actinomycetota bacterium]
MAERLFVIGGQRCGTTYLHGLLDEHPEIAMARPALPEPKFFYDDDLYRRGLDWYDAHFFAEAGDEPVRGEKSVGYLESDRAAERIAGAFPGASLVVLLRDPVDRAVSNYWFTVGHGLEHRPIDEALRDEDAGMVERDGEWFLAGGRRIAANPFIYVRRSRYVEDLRRWSDRFGRDRMHIMVFEDTMGSETAVAGLYGFLGVDASFRPSALGRVVHASSRDGELPDGLRRTLAEGFEPYNRALEAEYCVDLGSWRREGAA